jgi:uncharacterized repeat protein (TIGR03803 family)
MQSMRIYSLSLDARKFNPRPGAVVRPLLFLAGFLFLCAVPARAADRQVVHNPVPAAVSNPTPLRHSSPWRRLDLAIGLPLRDREGLTNLLVQLYDPASPNFRHYLTPEQFTQRFGPTDEDYQSVVKFARTHGLVVTGLHPGRTLVDVKGPVSAIERAFHVRLNDYQHPTENRTFFAPDAEPSLDLTTPVLSVAGLDNYIVPRPCMRPKPAGQARPDATGSGPGGAYLGYDFRNAYLPGVTLTGAGQTCGMLEFESGFYQSDVTAYEVLANLPDVPVTAVLLDGYDGEPGNGNAEVSLDIEMAISMAPGLAGVRVYEGASTDDILDQMAQDSFVKQISASWTYPVDATSDQYFLQFAAQGQSYFNASGDGDAYTGAPDTPTDDPNITIVGGTTLTTVSTGGAWQSETVWNSGGGLGSAGGISTRYQIPSWQTGISMTASHGSTTMRNLPDVSFTADNIYNTYGGGQSESVVGTSCSVQLWGGLTALINQLAVTNGEATVGFINPAVYAIGKGQNVTPYTSLFHDTTNGNNEKTSSPNKFIAVPGYDLCTGWGTPNGVGILTAIGLPEALRITPLSTALFSGPVGGPFMPAAQTYLLTNGGAGSLRWSLANTSSWFMVSPTTGTAVQEGASDSVSVTVTAEASSLPAGSYTANLVFTDLGDNFAQVRQATLAVVTLPVITQQPTNQSLLEGMTATFTVGTASNALISYQWLDDGLVLRPEGNFYGTTSSTLTISNISGSDNGSYSVILSNASGTVQSSNAVLTYVASAPVVTQQPAPQVALPGASASFTVAAVGNTPYSYQWQLNGKDLGGNAVYSGVQTKLLTITNVSPEQAGTYSVTVRNFMGSNNSDGALLTVTPITSPGLEMSPLVSFAGAAAGAFPYAPVMQGPDGNLYGTTSEEGANSDGTIYKVTTNGALTTVIAFKDSNGSVPYAGLCLGPGNVFYGSSALGGTYEDGVLFKTTANGAFNNLTNFNGNNGSEPVASLLAGSDGNFYGTALEGGAYDLGTIFRLTPGGALTTVVSFDGVDGGNPSSALIQGSDGYFYGTTEEAGEFGFGTVFKMSPSGEFTNLYSFTGGDDGGSPVPGLVEGGDGNYYGTTFLNGAGGFGTVFEMTSSGALTTRYSFTGGMDGGNPWGGLVAAADGNLYGTTQVDGTYGFGTVFRLSPSGTFSTVGQFDGYIGAYPSAALIQGTNGNLYGTTLGGGLYNDGVVYSLNFGGPLQITGQPATQTAYLGGPAAFTVATFGGAPVFYQWRQDGVNLTNGPGISGANAATLAISNVSATDAAIYTVVVSNAFNSLTSDGAALEVILSPPTITTQPASRMCVTGMTITLSVTAQSDQPFTYQWQENGTNLTDGGVISGSTTSALTFSGVTLANSGTYSVVVSDAIDTVSSSAAVLTVLPGTPPVASTATVHLFNGGSDGAFPYGGLVQGSDGNIYGTADGGGKVFAGTIFKVTPAGTMTTTYSFPSTPEGANPLAGLFQARNGNYYGTTSFGGAEDVGAVFRMTLNPTSVKVLYSFEDGNDGATPADSLIEGTDGDFYGTTFNGGSNGVGAVFKMTANGTLTTLYGFTDGNDGANPYAGLIEGTDGNFYGTTLEGGAAGYGTVYRLGHNGEFDTLAFFDGTNGAFPQGGVIQGMDGKLYGTASSGGSNGFGTVFSLTTNGTLTTLTSFNDTNGSVPAAALVQGTDGNLYGTTSAGGAGGQGTAFRITTGGALTTLLWFDGLNGADSESPMIQASDGSFYGTTAQGGNGFNPSAGGGNGAIFRLVVPLFISNSITATPAIAALPYAASLSALVIAPQGDALDFSKVSGPAWLNVAPGGSLSGTPANSEIGTNAFVVSFTDSNGVSASASLSISVIPDPAPYFILNPFAEPWASLDEAYSASIATNATDAEINNGDVLTFGKISGPAWLNVASNGALSGVATNSTSGTNSFVVGVTNLGGASNMATMYIYVAGAPSFMVHNFALPSAGIGLSYSGTIATNANNPNAAAGGVLTFYKVTGPAWLNIAENGTLSGVPASTNAGVNDFLVLVVESSGLADTASMSINVVEPSALPITLRISLQGASIVLSWSGGSGPYQVKTSTNLNSGVWQNLGSAGGATTLLLSPTNVSSYYEIQGQ